jgi:spoIIIJ-associated protein
VEWVQTTAKSVEEAKDQALDELGVDEQDAEFEVLDEPRSGLFGRVRGTARVKARVRPTQPRAKNERRDRGRGKGRGKGKGRGDGRNRSKGDGRNGGGNGGGRGQGAGGKGARGDDPGENAKNKDRQGKPRSSDRKGGRRGGAQADRASSKGKSGGRDDGSRQQDSKDRTRKETTMTEDVAIEEQGDIVAGFLEGLLDAFGADGEVVQEQVDESTVELRVEGDDLGLLIGPRGATLTAVHEMCRTVLQREVAGGARARIRVDIGGYRERRREALAQFARAQAEGVVEDQTQRALEPMGAADRKVIHDTVNDIDGVRTISEGEDPRRRVVLVPDGD